MTKEEADKLLRKALKKKKSIAKVEGAFGDKTPNLAFIEEIRPEGIKFYFNSFIYPGNLDSDLHDRITIFKKGISETIRLFWWAFPFISTEKLIDWFNRIYSSNLLEFINSGRGGHLTRFPKEILHAGYKAIPVVPLRGEYYEGTTRYNTGMIFHFLAYFIYSDFAYYTRFQDVLSNLNKYSLAESPLKEIVRLVKLAVERENIIRPKVKLAALFVRMLLMRPLVKKVIVQFLTELDLSNVRPTKDDLYYAFRRFGYNTLGATYADRMELVKIQDDIKGNFVYE